MDRPDPLGTAPFHFEDFFRDGLHLACPRCAAHLVARFGHDASRIPYWERPMSLACRACGHNRSGELSYGYWRDGISFRFQMLSPWLRSRPAPAGGDRAESKAELWARIHCLGHELVAVNPWHARAMRAYIAPLVRPECPLEHASVQDWRRRLPPWMTAEGNRDAVVGAISRLSRRFDEAPADPTGPVGAL